MHYELVEDIDHLACQFLNLILLILIDHFSYCWIQYGWIFDFYFGLCALLRVNCSNLLSLELAFIIFIDLATLLRFSRFLRDFLPFRSTLRSKYPFHHYLLFYESLILSHLSFYSSPIFLFPWQSFFPSYFLLGTSI